MVAEKGVRPIPNIVRSRFAGSSSSPAPSRRCCRFVGVVCPAPRTLYEVHPYPSLPRSASAPHQGPGPAAADSHHRCNRGRLQLSQRVVRGDAAKAQTVIPPLLRPLTIIGREDQSRPFMIYESSRGIVHLAGETLKQSARFLGVTVAPLARAHPTTRVK